MDSPESENREPCSTALFDYLDLLIEMEPRKLVARACDRVAIDVLTKELASHAGSHERAESLSRFLEHTARRLNHLAEHIRAEYPS